MGAGNFGVIKFPGNPWPQGHRIADFVWTARLAPGIGVWFDFHLQSAPYDEGDPPADDSEDNPDDDWTAKIVWRNYHRCTLSSTKWPTPGPRGFLVATEKEPLDLVTLSGRRFRVDRQLEDRDGEQANFHLYLLGHDTAADHTIEFSGRRGARALGITWKGRIALTYAGDRPFAHRFTATIARAKLAGVCLPEGMDRPAARRQLATLLRGADELPLIVEPSGARAPA